MNAGLPGTGIGGLFYLACALWMPINELILTLRGQSSRERWRLVARQLALAAGIIACLAGSYWLMSFYHLVNWTGREEHAEAQVRTALGLAVLGGAAAVVLVVLLAAFLSRRRGGGPSTAGDAGSAGKLEPAATARN